MQRLILELVPCLLVGLVLGLRFPGLPFRLAHPLVAWGVPVSLVGLLLRSGLRGELLLAGVMGLAGPGLTLLAFRLPPVRRIVPTGTLQLGGSVGNTAYWGLPVALALLPPAAIGYTITYDLAATLLTWSVGPLLVEGIPASAGALLRALRASPALRGVLLALTVQLTPWSAPVAAALWLPARLVFLLALAMVGMRLGVMLGRPSTAASAVAVGLPEALATKLLACPLLMVLLAQLLRLPPLARDAVVLQSAAPTAISVLLMAEAAGGREPGGPAEAAGLVLWSTLLALVTVPLWSWLLSGPLAF